jgi:hypothetical protein
VPTAAVYKKMSKVNIIHHALEYIHLLRELLDGDQTEQLAPASVPNAPYHPYHSMPFNHPSHAAVSPYGTSTSSSLTSSSQSADCWAMMAQPTSAQFMMMPSPFLTPCSPQLPYHQQPPMLNSPAYAPYASAAGPSYSPANSAQSKDSSQPFGQFSPVTPPSPDEEEDVLDAIVEWQSC